MDPRPIVGFSAFQGAAPALALNFAQSSDSQRALLCAQR